MTSERRRRHSSRGFTLLEMLVVLLVAGMALVLTSQALGQYQRAHTRAIASERTGREQRLGEAWFRASVRGLHAVGGDAAFAGTAEGFEGVTLAPPLEEIDRREAELVPATPVSRLLLSRPEVPMHMPASPSMLQYGALTGS